MRPNTDSISVRRRNGHPDRRSFIVSGNSKLWFGTRHCVLRENRQAIALPDCDNCSGSWSCLHNELLGYEFIYGTGACGHRHSVSFLCSHSGVVGVFLTGSDTSSNALFGSLQKTTATQIGVDPALTVAANSSGGVCGKMISPQSIAVATAATGLVGQEGSIFRFTLKHSIAMVLFICVLTMLQAYVLKAMLP